jgi:hypothetical protein
LSEICCKHTHTPTYIFVFKNVVFILFCFVFF